MPKKQILPRWDLTEYYKSLSDPQLKKDKQFLKTAGVKFSAKYKKKISNKNIYQVIKELEKIHRTLEHVFFYFDSIYNTDMHNEKKSSLLQEIKEIYIELLKDLMFFDLEIKKLSQKDFKKLISNPKLEEYKYFLQNIYRFKKHTLSEAEEKILADKILPATMAWQRLHGEINSSLIFNVRGKKMNMEEVFSLGYQSDRQLRKQAGHEITNVLEEKSKLYAQIYNNIVLDRNQTNKLREHRTPEESRILHDGNSVDVVDLIEKVTLKNYPLCAKHYNLKKKILKLDKLYEYDRYAPLNLSKQKKYSFSQAKAIILNSFKEFDLEIYTLAKKFFNKNWIDVPTYNGKRGGAYCNLGTDTNNPRILLNYTGQIRDVLTLSHEIGHGIHAIYSQKQNFMNFECTMPMAEIASTFCENITFAYLLNQTQDEKMKLEVIVKKLEADVFATLFRQMAFYRFEKQVHRKRLEKELFTDEINNIWQTELQAMFGKSLVLTDNHKSWWQYVSHFFNSPFYVYSYVFGGLISMALYNEYTETGDKAKFINLYKQLLSSGGSDKPERLLKKVGINIKDEKFWQGGYNVVKNLIDQEYNLYKKICKK
ncbi:MAG: M3 family oligoendopeptidase [Patescibacteria group bacterium]